MNTVRALKKYADVIINDVFAMYEKEFAQRVNAALATGYLQKLREPPLVEIIENVVNGIDDLTIKSDKPYFELSTKSAFIHDTKNKTLVEFDYYGESVKRELGDLIFIISVIFNGEKYFEKFTINQFKKDKTRSKNVSWNISNKEQLYLLSRFPTFKGVDNSIIPTSEYNLLNYSGCLGSYGLLYRPGDFSFVSATELDCFIGDKNSLKMNELYDLTYEKREYLFPYFSYFYPDINGLLYLAHRFYKQYGFKGYSLWNLFGNYHHAYNAFDFAHKYLRIAIGEPIFMKMGVDNSQARCFLHDLLSAARIKAQRKKKRKLLNLLDGFFRYHYAGNEEEGGFRKEVRVDFDGGGIGIIHTTINLGE